MDREQFIERLAHHYDQFNFIHPFREGNGRTQRVFWMRVAGRAGWLLDWRNVTGLMNDRACRVAAVDRDFTLLYELLDLVVSRSVPVRKPTIRTLGDMMHIDNSGSET